MSRLRGLLSSVTFWLLAGQVATAGTAFLLNILSSSSLDPAERGWLALFLQLGYLATTVGLLGTERPFMAENETAFDDAVAHYGRVIRPAVAILLVLLIVAAVGTIVLGDSGLGTVLGLAVVFVFTNVQVRTVRTAYVVSRSWRPYVAVTIGGQILLLIMGIALAARRVEELLPWLGAYTASGLVATAAVVTTARRSPHRARPKSDSGPSDRQLRRRGLRLLPASVGQTAMVRSDRLLLPLLAGPAALGVYVMAATALELAAWPVRNWCDARLSLWKSHARDGGLPRWRLLALGAAATAALALAMDAVVWLAVRTLLGPEYQGAVHLLLPLTLLAILYGSVQVIQACLIAYGREGRASVVETLALVVAVAAMLVLIPAAGGAGAAWGSVLGYGAALLAGVRMLTVHHETNARRPVDGMENK